MLTYSQQLRHVSELHDAHTPRGYASQHSMPSCGGTLYLSPPAGVHAGREPCADGGIGGESANGGRGGACGISSMTGSDAGACIVEPAWGAVPLASRSRVELRTRLLSLAFLARD